jgi:hypothetical protein
MPAKKSKKRKGSQDEELQVGIRASLLRLFEKQNSDHLEEKQPSNLPTVTRSTM